VLLLFIYGDFMAIMLTSKANIQQVKSGLWRTLENVLCMLDDGRIVFVPRNFLTDLITFISCDFADVRAAIIHDVGCKYHQLIYVNLSLEQLRKCGYLYNVGNEWKCKDIPLQFLQIENVGFLEINKIFKQALIACYENKLKADVMYGAVHLNVSWLGYTFKRPKIDINKFYGEEW